MTLTASGLLCPFGAHIRRANPRNADLPPSNGLFGRLVHMLGFGNASYRDDVIASTRFHRMIRRGREYGPRLTPEEAWHETIQTLRNMEFTSFASRPISCASSNSCRTHG